MEWCSGVVRSSFRPASHAHSPLAWPAAQLGITGVNPTDTIEFDFSAQVVMKAHH
jgi:hypothetical protein